MKAEITRNGLLCISAETELEAYALSRWLEENPNVDTATTNQMFYYGINDLHSE